MKEETIKTLICPKCGYQTLSLEIRQQNEVEITEGFLRCKDCNKSYTINHGLVFLYSDLSPAAEREQAAAEEEKDEIISERRQRIARLSSGNASKLLEKLHIRNKKILEIGAGSGWLSSKLASNNNCVALDIVPIPKPEIFFERIVSDMVSLPFTNESFDIVVICAAAHHSSDIKKTFLEIFRVLQPGGQMVLISEPNRGIFGSRERREVEKDLKNGFNEQRYSLFQWKHFSEKSGFITKCRLPENISEVIRTRIGFLPLPSFLLKLLPYLLLTLFDGFFNILAIKPVKR
mgnify:CR=1 FL=1